jgi:hypothetical protein
MLLASIEIIDTARLPELLVGIVFDAISVGALALLILRRSSVRATPVFSIVVVNMVVFFATYVMSNASIGSNVGFGLFALFGILRFRTGTLPVVEMTYLFASIALAAFNALALTTLTLVEALIANAVVVLVLELLGGHWLGKQPGSHSVVYERVELLQPHRRAELIDDLSTRTGLDVVGVVVEGINFLNDTAKLTVRALPATKDSILVHSQADQFEL